MQSILDIHFFIQSIQIVFSKQNFSRRIVLVSHKYYSLQMKKEPFKIVNIHFIYH